jgi:2-dehydropantoate 2-reductase
MRIAILGAGAIGSYYGALLLRAGHDVELLARGEHRKAVAEAGLTVRTPEEEFIVRPATTDDPERLRPAELVLVAVKSYSLPEIAPAARRMAEAGGDLLPLLNGVVAADELIESGAPPDRVLGGVTAVSVSRPGPGRVVRHSPFQTVIVGELGGGLSSRVEAVAEAFAGAGVDGRASSDIRVDLWRKFIFLSTLSAACGLARAPLGRLRATEHGRRLLERAVGEAAAVARGSGARLASDEEAKILESIHRLPQDLKPSLLLDLERGGPTEVDVLSGEVSRRGRALGLDTPVHDTATAAIALQEPAD